MYTLVARRTALVAWLAAAVLTGIFLFGGQTNASPIWSYTAPPLPPAQSDLPTKNGDPKLPPMSEQTIPGSPLRIVVRDDTASGVFYNDSAQFSSDYAEGIFMWVNGQVWGPSVPFGPSVNTYTPVSNSLTGNGTQANPWRVSTVVNLGSTGIQLWRSVRYENGALWTRQDFEVRNNSNSTRSLSLFHAADLKTAGVDSGYGLYHGPTGAIGGYNEARTFYQLFMPLSPGSLYKEDIWNSIWAAIGSTSGPGPGFNNSYQPDVLLDNGAGLQWTFSLGPGQRTSIADFHTFTTSPGCSANYIDVYPSDFYFESVGYLSCMGAITGYADRTFRPGFNTTRAQLSKIIVTAEGWPVDLTGAPHFSDVLADNPFYNYIETAYNHGIITGYADGTFRPGNDVTRSQLSKIIVLAEGWPTNTSGGPHFSDVPISHAFYAFVETAYNRQIISGYADGTFKPGNPATRGQISKIVYNAITAP